MTGMPVLSDVDLRKVMEEDEGIIILNMREKSIQAQGTILRLVLFVILIQAGYRKHARMTIIDTHFYPGIGIW